MFFFSDMLVCFLFFSQILYVYCEFLICGYHGVHTCLPITIYSCFEQVVI